MTTGADASGTGRASILVRLSPCLRQATALTARDPLFPPSVRRRKHHGPKAPARRVRVATVRPTGQRSVKLLHHDGGGATVCHELLGSNVISNDAEEVGVDQAAMKVLAANVALSESDSVRLIGRLLDKAGP